MSRPTYLEAFCHLRGERRTFRLDRIASWVVEDVRERVSARPPASPAPAPAAPARARRVRRPARRSGSALALIGAAAIAGLIGYG